MATNKAYTHMVTQVMVTEELYDFAVNLRDSHRGWSLAEIVRYAIDHMMENPNGVEFTAPYGVLNHCITNASVTEAQFEYIHEQAEKNGMSVSQAVRIALVSLHDDLAGGEDTDK